MALPNIVTPEYETTLPSTDQKIKFRPFLVKEEKLMLMAAEGKDQTEIYKAVLKVLSDCILNKENLDVTDLPLFDIEWLFLQLRSKSVGEVVELRMKHVGEEKCNAFTDVEIKLDEVKVEKFEGHNPVVMLDDNVGITLKYPNLTDVAGISTINAENIFKVLEKSIKNVFDKDRVYTEFSKEEINEFIGNMDNTQFLKVTKFFETIPKLRHKVEYKCQKCGKQVKHTLEGLMDFFL